MQSVYIDPTFAKKNQGPGSYNIESATDLCKKRNSAKVVDWSRNTEQRFHQGRNKTPGPGSYSVEKAPRRNSSSLSSAFAYQGLRSCID